MSEKQQSFFQKVGSWIVERLCIILPLAILLFCGLIEPLLEKEPTQESYEATILLDNRAIFCIADGYPEHKYVRLDTIHLPYGRTEYIDEKYYADDSSVDVSLGVWGLDGELVLGKLATENSYERLENQIIASSGDFCASRKSDVFHFAGCPSAKNIKPENKVWFDDDRIAFALGFEICDRCNELL